MAMPGLARSYGFAVLVTLGVAAARFFLFPLIGDVAPYTPFVISVMIAASFGGFGPGLVATVLGVGLGVYFYVAPYFSLAIEQVSEWIAVSLFLVAGVTISWICEALHITRRRLENKRRELEDEVLARRSAEQLARDREQQLRAADQRKDVFLAMLAHELRSPLVPIRCATSLLRQRQDPELQRIHDVCDRQVSHLSRLMEDLLDLSRIGSGKLTLRREAIRVATAVTAAVESSKPLIEARRHDLRVTLEPLVVEADLVRLTQVFSNLLENAAKYTEPGGHIWLIVEPRDRYAEIRVRDSGVGIPSEQLGHVFDLFFQGSMATKPSRGGLGLGLSLVRRLVEMHGGTIEARSHGVGLGSEFVVRLPLAAPHAFAEAREPGAWTDAGHFAFGPGHVSS